MAAYPPDRSRAGVAFVAVICLFIGYLLGYSSPPPPPHTIDHRTENQPSKASDVSALTHQLTALSQQVNDLTVALQRTEVKRTTPASEFGRDSVDDLEPPSENVAPAPSASSAPPLLPVAVVECQPHVAISHADRFRASLQARGQFAACASAKWMEAIRNADAAKASPPERILINVGANKGFVISQFLALFASHLGHNPQSLYNFLVSNPTLLQTMPRERAAIWACGSCGDCHEVVPARPATAAKQSVLAHAIEPIGMNVQLIRDWQTNRSIGTDILGVHQLACTIDDGPVTMEIPVANSQLPGEEGAHLTAAQPKDSASGDVAITVEGTRIDTFINKLLKQHQVVDFLFLDMEGYDPYGLQSAQNAMDSGRIRLVVFEHGAGGLFRGNSNGVLKQQVDFMNEHGYTCYMDGMDYITRLTGCWDSRMGDPFLANVICGRRTEHEIMAILESIAQQ